MEPTETVAASVEEEAMPEIELDLSNLEDLNTEPEIEIDIDDLEALNALGIPSAANPQALSGFFAPPTIKGAEAVAAAQKNEEAQRKAASIEFDATKCGKINFKNNLYMTTAGESDTKFNYEGELIVGFSQWVEKSGDSMGEYYTGTLDGIAPNANMGDYSYFLNSRLVGCTILRASQ